MKMKENEIRKENEKYKREKGIYGDQRKLKKVRKKE